MEKRHCGAERRLSITHSWWLLRYIVRLQSARVLQFMLNVKAPESQIKRFLSYKNIHAHYCNGCSEQHTSASIQGSSAAFTAASERCWQSIQEICVKFTGSSQQQHRIVKVLQSGGVKVRVAALQKPQTGQSLFRLCHENLFGTFRSEINHCGR